MRWRLPIGSICRCGAAFRCRMRQERVIAERRGTARMAAERRFVGAAGATSPFGDTPQGAVAWKGLDELSARGRSYGRELTSGSSDDVAAEPRHPQQSSSDSRFMNITHQRFGPRPKPSFRHRSSHILLSLSDYNAGFTRRTIDRSNRPYRVEKL